MTLIIVVIYAAGFAWMMREVRWNWTLNNIAFAATWPVWAILWTVTIIGLVFFT